MTTTPDEVAAGKLKYGRRTRDWPIYQAWLDMRKRCRDVKRDDYYLYGGRGIKVCARWASFANFLADMGEHPKGLSLERANNNGNYEPGNCRWATPQEQNLNTRAVRIISVSGQRDSLRGWARKLGIDPATLRKRLRAWPIERALAEKPRYALSARERKE